MSAKPTLWLIAGPNGAGKTTYAFKHVKAVSGSVRFVNLDEIARGLSPLEPSAAGSRAARVALALTRELMAEGRSFSIETTLAGMTHLRTLSAAQAAGFGLNLLYFSVASVAICQARVARRVSEGGHDVPDADLRRRFDRSLARLPHYLARVDLWRIFDATGPRPCVAAEGRRGCVSTWDRAAALEPRLPVMLAGLPPCAEEGGKS